jgi:hypothetical protein
MNQGAKREGAEYIYLIEAEGGSDRYGLNGLPPLHVALPSRVPSHRALVALDDALRREGAPYDSKAVRGYEVKSTDGSQVFAKYENHTFSDIKNKL